MKYNTLKNIGKIVLIGSILYFLNPRESIAPEFKPIMIESGKVIKEDTRKIIVLDPGHGMSNAARRLMDWGTIYQKYKEAEVTLEQAKKVKEMLNPNLYKVILTREDNTNPSPIEKRAELANKLNANLFISFHLNYNKDADLSGSQVYYRDSKSRRLAKSALENLGEMTSIPKNFVKKEDEKVLKGLKCPGVLIESAYLKKDIKYITDTIPDIERAIAKTIEDYLNNPGVSVTTKKPHKYL
jgi:N-acetylmuramoyl-L-alanine amidase